MSFSLLLHVELASIQNKASVGMSILTLANHLLWPSVFQLALHTVLQVQDPTWRDVVPHFHRLSEAELAAFAQPYAGARPC